MIRKEARPPRPDRSLEMGALLHGAANTQVVGLSGHVVQNLGSKFFVPHARSSEQGDLASTTLLHCGVLRQGSTLAKPIETTPYKTSTPFRILVD